MTRRPQLEIFELPDLTGERIELAATDLEDAKLASFEKGYCAGWEDALAMQESEKSQIRADLARNLQELSFTHHEVRTHILQALQPLLREMVAKVLPAIARESLAPMVLETLRPEAERLADTPISLVVNPTSRARVETLLSAQSPVPLRFVEEPSLGEGQVYLRMGHAETHVDLDAVVVAIAKAVSAFFQIETEDKIDG